MTLNEWVKDELEYWKDEQKKATYSRMESYCTARIDAANAALKFIEINERDAI